MTRFALVFCCAIFSASCNAQSRFDDFVKKFPRTSLPIDSLFFTRQYPDTLDVRAFNYFVWDSQPKETTGKGSIVTPKVWKKGKLDDAGDFGRANESMSRYTDTEGRERTFKTTINPVAQIDIRPDYYTLIVKEVNSEQSSFVLYSFSRDGKRLSAVTLYSYFNRRMFVDKIGHVITSSKILKDGSIAWVEKANGLTTTRTYALRADGYFEIIAHKQTGEFEY